MSAEYSVEEVQARFEAWAMGERGYTEWEINGLRCGDDYLPNCDLHLAWKAWQKAGAMEDEDVADEIFPGTKHALDRLVIKRERTGEPNV